MLCSVKEDMPAEVEPWTVEVNMDTKFKPGTGYIFNCD